jgi:hypothetical protein
MPDVKLIDWPTNRSEVTAELLATYSTQRAQLAAGYADGADMESPGWRRSIAAFVDAFSVATLMRVLIVTNPDVAEEAARFLFEALDDGENAHDYVREWLRAYDMDPVAIHAEGVRRAQDAES